MWKQAPGPERALARPARLADPVALAARRDGLIAVAGCALVLTALALIWAARAVAGRSVYVSELGSIGMPTQTAFYVALLALVAGGSLIAWSGRRVRAEVGILQRWMPSVSLWVASGLFLVAAQVPCTYSCPTPWSYAFTIQDAVHISAAVAAFAMACLAMLQASLARRHRAIAISSAVCAWAVAGIAGLGGLIALSGVALELGALCEFVATTIAIAWVVLLGAALAVEHLRAGSHREAPSSGTPSGDS